MKCFHRLLFRHDGPGQRIPPSPQSCLAGSCGQQLFRTARSPAGISPEVSSGIQAPLGAALAPFAQVSCQTREKVAGGGGVTTQAGGMQQGTAQGSPGEIGGVHGRWDLRESPIRSARGSSTVFIIRNSFSSCVLRLVTGDTLLADLAVCYGAFTPYTDGGNCPMLALDWRLAVARSSTAESPAKTSRPT